MAEEQNFDAPEPAHIDIVPTQDAVEPAPVDDAPAPDSGDKAGERVDTAEPVRDVVVEAKPLSSNKFAAFFQRIYRWWLGKWYGFADGHKKIADLIYMVFFFLVFSVGVTVYQYIVMTFLPYAFAALNSGAWGWPNVPVSAAGGEPYVLFGDANGLGYFIAFELATFTAQCINFPLQRNITYRSHGNVAWQIMWYFIGWVLISVFTLALWGIINCFLVYWHCPEALAGLLKTVITGGVSMVIFFFIFMIIFPNRKKVAENLEKKLEKLRAANAPAEKIAAVEAKAKEARKAADLADAEKNAAQAATSADARAVAYESAGKRIQKLTEKGAAQEEIAAAVAYREKAYADAVAAMEKCDEMQAEYSRVKSVYGVVPTEA